MAAINIPETTIVGSTNGSYQPDPTVDSKPWDTYTINGTPCPGIIDRDGIQGFDRTTTWDQKIGKGSLGAVATGVAAPPVHGSITSVLWQKGMVPEWQAFAGMLEYQADKVNNTKSFSIYHPALAINNVTAVVVRKVGPVRHHGLGRRTVTVEFEEWTPAPKTSAVSTPIQPGADFGPLPTAPQQQDTADAQAALFQAGADRDAAAASLTQLGLPE